MSQESQIDAPVALHHIITRGIEFRKLFTDDLDRNNFLEHMEEKLEIYGAPLTPTVSRTEFLESEGPMSTVRKIIKEGYRL